ncbi:MAG: response regulator [Deltaproteobacteria bacterium]|nr:response regulator [Deltaproteobacteria bacterium]
MAINPDRRRDERAFLRLLAVLFLLAVLPCLVIGYVIYRLEQSRHIEQTAVLLDSLAADRELATRLLIERRRDELSFLARNPRIERLARDLATGPVAESSEFLKQVVNQNPFFAGLSVIDSATGRSQSAGTFSQEIAERSAEEIKRQERSFVRAETLPGGERVLLFGQSIHGPVEGSGDSGLVLVGVSRLTIFGDLYNNTAMLGDTGESFLTDSKGYALTTLRYSSHHENHSISAEAMLDCLAGNSEPFVITPDYANVPTAMSYRPVKNYGGCVMVHMRASEVMAPINTLRNMVVAIVATIITAVTLTAFLVVRKLLRMDKERTELEEGMGRLVSHMEALVAERTVELKDEINGRIDAELKLRESEAFLESIVHNVHEVIFAVNVEAGGDFRFIWCNANGEKMISAKYPDASGRTLEEVYGPDTGERLALRYSECIKNGVIECEEVFNTTMGARVLLATLVPVVDETGRVVQIISSAIDITERKKLEGEMVKAQKLESLGVLAGGLAHDFNNLLAVIRLNTSILKSTMPDPESLEMLNVVDHTTVLATGLTNQLLTFSKGGKPIKKPLQVCEFLNDVADFSLRGTKTTCKLNLAEGLLDIEADRGQMTQVINNMLINADQAMPDGGVVTLSAENIEITGLDKGLPLKQGRYVKITIEDHGEGIPEENLSRIFDPYFTTKKKGSGLGLASSYSIIKNHNGHISVRSSIGLGTVFEVFMPALVNKASVDANDTDILVKVGGRVLVMDDDDIVRISICKALDSLGYDMDSASNGQEAILKYKEGMENGEPFDAVILDLTVPMGMGGEEAVTKILELAPSAKVFVSSGYSNTSVVADFKKYGFCGFLQKPYAASELDRKLQEAIIKKM